MCSNYYCAWAQGLMPEEMRPDKIGALVSVEWDQTGKQILKSVSINNLREDVEKYLIDFVTKHNTNLIKTKVIPIRRA